MQRRGGSLSRSPCAQRGGSRCVLAAATLTTAQESKAARAAPLPALQDLPASLRNNVVVLDASPSTRVYLLGMSHVSKASVDQVKELVRTVRPDVVGVELCRSRLPLLVDEEEQLVTNLVWHCRKIQVEGLPDAPEWPKWDQLRPLLRCRAGRPVTMQDIEADVSTLLSTGLFRSVRPLCGPAGMYDAPAFLATSAPASTSQEGGAQEAAGPRVQAVPPLGCIRFVVQERALPPISEMSVRVDSSLKGANVAQTLGISQIPTDEQLQEVCDAAKADNAPAREGGQVPALKCLMRAQQKLAELFGDQSYSRATTAEGEGAAAAAAAAAPRKVVVSFLGVETGKVEVLVRLAREDEPLFASGFEASASNGEGWGIEVFRPKKNLFKISDKLFLPMEEVDKLRAQARGLTTDVSAQQDGSASSASSSSSASGGLEAPRTAPLKPWTDGEIDACSPPEFEGSIFADTLGALLMGLYAKHQSAAARKLEVTPGAAWQAALQAATEVGAQQVVLIDRPTVVTERRLSDALVASSGWRIGASAGLVLSTLVATLATSVLPELAEVGAMAGAVAASTVLLWPLIKPLREIEQLAEMTPEQIEDAVRVKQPIASGDLSQPLKLFGEDALLDWPGALGPVIRDRDTYMARALAAAATGASPFSPLFVRDQVDGQLVWRFAVPEGAPAASAPVGFGDGAVPTPLQPVRAVVGIVGSAHVPGMVREWDEALRRPTDVQALLQAQQQ